MSPAGKEELKCFAVKRGELAERFDAHFHRPEFRKNLTLLLTRCPKVKRIDQIAKIICGPFGTEITSADYKTQGIPLLRISNITKEGTIDENDLVFLSERKADSLLTTQVYPGDMVISQRGTLGMPAVVPNSYTTWNISANLIAIKSIQEISPSFLQLFLSSTLGRSQLERRQSGQVQGKITTEDVASVLVPISDKEKSLVAELEAARETRRENLQKADELLSGLDEWLMERLRLTTAPADVRTIFALKLEQLKGHRIDVPAYRPFFAKGHLPKIPLASLSDLANIDSHVIRKPEDENELVPYVGLPECEQTEVREVVMRPYHEVKGRSVVKPGDILFARIEPSIFNKKYVFVEDLKGHEYAYTSTEFYVVTPNHSEADPHYLYTMFFCSFVFNQVKGKTTGSSGRRRLDPELFQSLQFPKPSMKMQQTIATEVRRRRTETRRLRVEAKAEWESAKISFEEKLLGSRV